MRRRLTVKRLDPWSVLKFGVVANLVAFAISLLVAGVVWFIVDRLELVDQACSILLDVGFTSCALDGSHLFRILALLGAMGVIVATAVLVFASFLYNLIADLTGGLTIGVIEDGVGPARPESPVARTDTSWPARSESREAAPVATSSGQRVAPADTADGVPTSTASHADPARTSSSSAARPDEDLFGDR